MLSNFLTLRRNITSLKQRQLQQVMPFCHHQDFVNRCYYHHHHYLHRGGQVPLLLLPNTVRKNVDRQTMMNPSFPTQTWSSQSSPTFRCFSVKTPSTNTKPKKIIQASNNNTPAKKAVVEEPLLASSCIITTTLPDNMSRGPYYDKLAAWYQQHHQMPLDPTSERWSIRQHLQQQPPLWTVTWNCPITQFQFSSGKLRKHPHYADAATAAVSVGGVGSDTIIGSGGGDNVVVAYPLLELALEAVCGHALDVLRFQQTGMLEPRRCRENPKEALLSLSTRTSTTTTPTSMTTATNLPKWKRTMPAVPSSSSSSPSPPPSTVTTIAATQVVVTETVTTTMPPNRIVPELSDATVVTTQEKQQPLESKPKEKHQPLAVESESPLVSAEKTIATTTTIAEHMEFLLSQASTTSTITPKENKKKKKKKVASSVTDAVAKDDTQPESEIGAETVAVVKKKKKKKKITTMESVTTPPLTDKEQSLIEMPSTKQNNVEEQVYNTIDTTLSPSTSASTALLTQTTTTTTTTTLGKTDQLGLPTSKEPPSSIAESDQELVIKKPSLGIAGNFQTVSQTKFEMQSSPLPRRAPMANEVIKQDQSSPATAIPPPADTSSVLSTVQPMDIQPQQQLPTTTTSSLFTAQPIKSQHGLTSLFVLDKPSGSATLSPTVEPTGFQQQGRKPTSPPPTQEPKQQAIEAEAEEDYSSSFVTKPRSDNASITLTTAFLQQTQPPKPAPISAQQQQQQPSPQAAHKKAEELSREKDNSFGLGTNAAMASMDSLMASTQSSDAVTPQSGHDQQHQLPKSSALHNLFAQQKTKPTPRPARRSVPPNKKEDRKFDAEPSSGDALLPPATLPTEYQRQKQEASFPPLIAVAKEEEDQLVVAQLSSSIEVSLPITELTESQQPVAAAHAQSELEGDDGDVTSEFLADSLIRPISTNDVDNPEQEAEEEYSIQIKPRRLSTLGYIMEAWVDDFNFQPVSTEQSMASSRLPMDEYPVQLENIVDRVQSWFRSIPSDATPSDASPPSVRARAENNRYKKTEENNEYTVTFTTAFKSHRLSFDSKAANRALSALAAVTSDYHAGKSEASSPLERRVEEVFLARSARKEDPAARREEIATQLLEKMWVSATDSNDRPTVETYNSYLKCLHGPSAQGAAKRASKILNLMQSGEKDESGRELPLPNCGTLNAVLHLWARVTDQATRREGIQDVYDQLVEGKARVIPSHDTFVTILSAEAEDGLDPDYACKWIDCMQKLSHEHPSLKPDSKVWNAPLRWSGDAVAADRPSSSWDKHSIILKSGFLSDDSDDHPHNKEPRDVEAWLDRMRGTDPALLTIETFESLIQAWVRTGTRQGLQQAELVAESTLESPELTPRLSTFHPIVAAWANSGDDEGPDKVEDWINRLRSQGGQCIPDGRLRSAYIRALSSLQVAKLDAIEPESDQSAQKALADEVKEIAKRCSQSLEVLCAEIGQKDTDIILNTSVFRQVVQAWTRSMTAYNRAGVNELDCIDQVAEELVQTVKHLDALIFKFQTQHDADKSPVCDQQRRHLMLTAGVVLDTLLHSMVTLNQYGQKIPGWDRSDSLPLRHLSQIEKFFRRFDEARQIYFKTEGRVESSGRQQRADELLHYRDGYYYHGPHLWGTNRSSIYSRFFASFELITPPPLPGDLIRISLYVAERAKTWEEIHRVGMDKMLRSQAKLLERLVPNRDEWRLIARLVDCDPLTIPRVTHATKMATAKAAARTPSKWQKGAVNGSRQHRPRARSSSI